MTPVLRIILATSVAVVCGASDIVSLRGTTGKSFIASTDETDVTSTSSSFIDTTNSQPSLPSYVKCRIGLPDDCAKGTYCAISPGVCTMSNTYGPMTTNNIFGQCKTLPKFCNRMYAPTCGCDGKTYSNLCVAASSGVNVTQDGECSNNNSSSKNRVECVYRGPGQDNCTNANEYCVIDERKCMLRIYEEQRGHCETKSINCSSNTTVTATTTTNTTTMTVMDEPICGCDFITYKNACLAHNVGINIMHNGECNASDYNDGDENDNTVPTNNDDVPKYLSLKSRITILFMAAVCYAVFLFMIYYAFVTLAAVTDRERARRAMRSSNHTGRSNNISSSTTTTSTAGSTRRLEVALLSR